jgi:hypothetical protein
MSFNQQPAGSSVAFIALAVFCLFVFAGACCLLTPLPPVACEQARRRHPRTSLTWQLHVLAQPTQAVLFPGREEWGCCGQAQRARAADRMESFIRLAKAERRRKNRLSRLVFFALPFFLFIF